MIVSLIVLLVLHLLDELFSRLEAGVVVSGNNHGSILLYVASCLLGTVLDNEVSETTQRYVFLVEKALLDGLHKAFNYNGYFFF